MNSKVPKPLTVGVTILAVVIIVIVVALATRKSTIESTPTPVQKTTVPITPCAPDCGKGA